MDLRLYQQKLLQDIRVAMRSKDLGGLGHRKICAVLPTGGGKTVIFSAMAAGAAAKGKKVWAVAHREELIFQMSDKFSKFGLHHGIIKPGVPETPSLVQCCMIQTIRNRMAKSVSLTYPDLLIIDECHHTPSSTYDELIKMMPETTIVVGFTATPVRMDGKGLANHFDHLVLGPNEQELTALGFLVPAKVYRPQTIDATGLHTRFGDYIKKEVEERMNEDPAIYGDLIDSWTKYANGLSTVWFTISVEWAYKLAGRFNDVGISAAAIHGGMTKDERRSTLAAFESGSILNLMSCDLVSEGFDLPSIKAVGLARLTKSLGLIRQMIGRGLRIEPGKQECIVLDSVGATRLHGLPDEPKDWRAYWDGATARESDEDEVEEAKTCKECYLAYRGKYCPDCGKPEAGSGEARTIEEVEGELVLVEQKRRYLAGGEYEQLLNAKGIREFKALVDSFDMEYEQCRKIVVARASSLEDLEKVARALSYHPEFANTTYKRRHGEEALKEELAKKYGGIVTQMPGVTPHA